MNVPDLLNQWERDKLSLQKKIDDNPNEFSKQVYREKLQYYEYLPYWASEGYHISVLNWWSTNDKIEFKYIKKIFRNACEHNMISILNWWLDLSQLHQIKLEYDETAIDAASSRGHIAILQ